MTRKLTGRLEIGFVTLLSLSAYAGYRFPPVIIQQAVWLYARFTLSFRDVEDLLAERDRTAGNDDQHA
jgi:transposase-like protein